MKIEDLIQLLNSRLNSFKLSKDYARMSGDLDAANKAEEEIITIEDTLYKLNLLVDVSKKAVTIDKSVANIILSNSKDVLNEYDITSYATDPLHEKKILQILKTMGEMNSAEDIDAYIRMKVKNSPVTGQMIINAAGAYSVSVRLMMAIMEQDSSFGTLGKAVRTLNPGNVGNDDEGNLKFFSSWVEGVNAVAEWLNRHRGKTIFPNENTEEIITPPTQEETTTTTEEVIVPPTQEETTTTTEEVIVPPTQEETTTTTEEVIVPPTQEETTTTTEEVIVPPTQEETTTSTQE